MKMNNNDDYVSVKKLFDACCYMFCEYHTVLKYLKTSFSIKNNFIMDYNIDYYDYKKNRLVIFEVGPFDFHDNDYYYFKLKNSCVFPAERNISKEKEKKYYNITNKYCEEITESINLLKEYKDFKTSKCKNIKTLGFPYLLALDSYGMTLSLVVDGQKKFCVKKDYYSNSNEFITNDSWIINVYSDNEKKILNNSYVRINDLPKWCIDSIINHSNRNVFAKIKKRFSKAVVSSEVIDRLKQSQRLESEKKKNLDSLTNKIGELINRVSYLANEDDYERIILDDYTILFEKNGDHLELKKVFIPLLKYIDLSFVPFNNVSVSGIDFTDSNVSLNPQKVYKKDLSLCKFGDVDRKENNIPFSISTNFNGVDLRGTVISDPHCDFHYNLKGAIVDESTSINYGNVDKNKAFFIKRDM